ncbi:hypothetical protein L1049_013068 [Liquidambar formosana]|uniref:RNase H type-1 domain-containing protein n=1 Tax=Liquidambar formosana TaxID=63359 RepID=A0AAP0RJV2_LIQFO
MKSDDQEKVLGAWLSSFPTINLGIAEAEVARLALNIAKDRDWTSCLIEGDSLKVVNAILKPYNCPWEFEVIISDIIEDL